MEILVQPRVRMRGLRVGCVSKAAGRVHGPIDPSETEAVVGGFHAPIQTPLLCHGARLCAALIVQLAVI